MDRVNWWFHLQASCWRQGADWKCCRISQWFHQLRRIQSQWSNAQADSQRHSNQEGNKWIPNFCSRIDCSLWISTRIGFERQLYGRLDDRLAKWANLDSWRFRALSAEFQGSDWKTQKPRLFHSRKLWWYQIFRCLVCWWRRFAIFQFWDCQLLRREGLQARYHLVLLAAA